MQDIMMIRCFFALVLRPFQISKHCRVDQERMKARREQPSVQMILSLRPTITASFLMLRLARAKGDAPEGKQESVDPEFEPFVLIS